MTSISIIRTFMPIIIDYLLIIEKYIQLPTSTQDFSLEKPPISFLSLSIEELYDKKLSLLNSSKVSSRIINSVFILKVKSGFSTIESNRPFP